jgi:uncharacterized membrane protein
MPVDEVADLLDRWRGTDGVFGRARVLREGIQLLAGLDADERRVLAGSLAEQGAPDLANRIEQRTGAAMSADQLWSVADGLLAMDDHQVDRLTASLRDPVERQRLAGQALTHGVASLDAATSPASDQRDRLDRLPPPGGIVDRAGVGDDLPAHPELGHLELGDQELGTVELGDAGLRAVGVHAAEIRHDAEAATTAADDPDPSGTSAVRTGSSAAVIPTADQVTDHTATEARADVSAPAPPTDDPAGEGPGTSTWLDRLSNAGTATRRLRLLAPDALEGLSGAEALEVLDAVPDGWQRRRAAVRLVDAGTFPTDHLVDALGRFGRTTDAAFVAGALLAAGHVRAERFHGILDERVVRRLVIRSER